ncbi:sensor histidine kinase [Serratia sp. J2]|uniref:sensor histidine kinase n=1 Tax=Serratia sp. J2 TaxID=3386551 RepID=UPI0039173347
MDGIKERVKSSIQLRLSIVLCSAIAVVALISGGFTFFSVLDEAHELQDATLTQIAGVLKKAQFPIANSSYVSQSPEDEEDDNVIVQFIVGNTAQSSRSLTYFQLQLPLSEGFQTISSGHGNYRVLVTALSPNLQVAIGQKTAMRDEVALDSAWRTLMPFMILLPVLLLIVADLIRKVFRPVTRLANDVYQRDEQDLTPLASEDIPHEVRPFVMGINRLLGKVGSAMENQRRFVADAAHELRSPLTALSLQAERLNQSAMSKEAHERLDTLRQGINRAKNLLEQLLSLARAQQQITMKTPQSPTSIQSVYRQVIEGLLPLALEKNIDLGVVDTGDITLYTDEIALFTVVKNLVENAIRYTPKGGCIDLRLYGTKEQVIIEVEDNGPGIAEDKRTRVFDAFYRIEGSGQSGSGLGLSIVKAIVSRMGGEVTLHNAANYPTGLQVRLLLPHRVPHD